MLMAHHRTQRRQDIKYIVYTMEIRCYSIVKGPGKIRMENGALDIMIRKPLILRLLFDHDSGKRNQDAGCKY